MAASIVFDVRSKEIVDSLQRPELRHEERRKLIMEPEVLPFQGRDAADLLPQLRQFIEEYSESNIPADLVVAGSAIRNYMETKHADIARNLGQLCELDASVPAP